LHLDLLRLFPGNHANICAQFDIMNPIGTTASLCTLIDLILETFKHVNKLTHSDQNAPAEIEELPQWLEGLSSNLYLLRRVQVAVHRNESTLDFDSADFDSLKRSLAATNAIFSEIHLFLKKKTLKNGQTARIKWAFGDASKVRAWEARLQSHSARPQTTLLLLHK
jgi:hypothetical protein